MKNTNLLTDDELVRLFVDGSNVAFETLLSRYKNRLYSYIFFIVRNKDICEDIFQETFVKAIVTIKNGKYNADGKFLAWVSRIAHNLIIDHFRRTKNENTSSADTQELLGLNEIQLRDKCIEDNIIREQVMVDVARLVDYLPSDQRQVIRMRYYEDLSFKEIAEKTGVSINTSIGRMRYAVINLRRFVAENNMYLEIN